MWRSLLLGKTGKRFRFSQLETKEQLVWLDHSQICWSMPSIKLVHHTITQSLWPWVFTLPTWVTMPTKLLSFITNSNPSSHISRDIWSSCQERSSLKPCNLLNFTIKLSLIRTLVIHASMSSILPQAFGLPSLIVQPPSNLQEWMLCRTLPRMLEKFLINLPWNTIRQDRQRLQSSCARLSLVPPL